MNTRIYIADTAALEDPVLYEGFYAAMPLWRKEKIDALRLQRDKRLSLGAGIALQKALSDIGIQQSPAVQTESRTFRSGRRSGSTSPIPKQR